MCVSKSEYLYISCYSPKVHRFTYTHFIKFEFNFDRIATWSPRNIKSSLIGPSKSSKVFLQWEEWLQNAGIECEGWRRHSSLILLILIFTKPNIEVSGWLYQTKTHFTQLTLFINLFQECRFHPSHSMSWMLHLHLCQLEVFL